MKRPTPELVEQMICEAIERDDVVELDRLARLLDELCMRKQPPSLLTAALWYARQGLHVFPIEPMRKTPYPRTHGVLEATSDVEQIQRWWSARADSNIGIATGHIIDVVDIDGLRGNVSLCRLLDELDFDPLASCVGKSLTPRPGGRHFYLPATGLGNGAALADGIDVRGKGGYVLAPPSRTELGLYSWTAVLDAEAARQAVAA